MNVSCEIIKDLLPLYYDNVCNPESRGLVEEHIKECLSCKKLLENISNELTRPINAADEAKPIKAIQTIWNKSKSKSFFKGTLLSVLLCAVLIGGFIGLTRWKIMPVSTDLIEISEVSQLSDGRIVFHLNVKDNKDLSCIIYTSNEDGSYFMTPMRSVIEGKRPEIGMFNNYFDIDIAMINKVEKEYEDGTVIAACYFGSPDNGILIWEEGMEIPAASNELEKVFKRN